jgi:site-specific recombinase XerC
MKAELIAADGHNFPNLALMKIAAKYNSIVGIDPDVTKSGYAILDVKQRKIQAVSLTFPELNDRLQAISRTQSAETHFIVVVEAGWLNAISNYHTAAGRKGQRIAKNVGANHQVGKMIVEMCEHYAIPVETIKPLKKMWRGKEGKITQEEIAAFTGITGRNNQEERDAALIAWVYAGLPIKLKQ